MSNPRFSILTLGTFDLFHWGHLEFLQICASFGDLTVGVNTDDFAATFKERPIMSQTERLHTIIDLGFRATLNKSSGMELIAVLEPDFIAVGSDWAAKDYLSQIDVNQEWLDNRRIGIIYVPRVLSIPISSSEIKRRVRERI